MTPNLTRSIRVARHRLNGTPLDEVDQIDQQRREASLEFQVLLSRKLDFEVRIDLLLRARYFWHEDSPAVAVTLEGHNFLLTQTKGGCLLQEEIDGQWSNLVELAAEDNQFEDRLLAALGGALDAG
jgi:hypothetical protein